MSSEELLLVFVKNPQLGAVKTRLAETVGDEQALQIYNQLLRFTRDIVAPLECDLQVWYSEYIPLNDIWDEIDAEKRTQQGATLGDRMKHAFNCAFDNGYKRVVIIGSDCAELKTMTLHRAFRRLKNKNTVIGPSADGGYYLLGMDDFYDQLFDGKEWSTSSVYHRTMNDIEKLELSNARLTELNDVDTLEDWEEVKFRFVNSTQ